MKLTGYYLVVVVCACAAVGLAYNTKRFEYSGYCQKMCMFGRGGNLCRCSAVHFAGKRGDEANLHIGGVADESIANSVEGEEESDPVEEHILSLIPAYQRWLEQKIRAGQFPESFKEYTMMQSGKKERR